MLITAYIILAITAIYLIVYYYRKGYGLTRRKEELKQEWGEAKNGRYFDFDLIENYFLNTITDSANKLQLISDKIANDLYLNDVFKIVDRTVSKLGQQYLYARLRTLDKDTTEVLAQDRLAEKMATDEDFRIKTQLVLQNLDKADSYYYQDLIFSEPISRPPFLPVVYFLTLLNVCCLIMALFRPGYWLVFMGIFIVNSAFHYLNKKIVDLHTSSLKEFIKVYEATLILDADPVLNKEFPETTEVMKKLAPLKRRMAGVKLETMTEGDLAMPLYLVVELVKIAFNIEIIIFYSIIDHVRKYNKELKKIFVYIGTIDTAISIASYRSSLDYYCKPNFTDTAQMELLGVKHPLIVGCVPNDLELKNKNLLLTGSNMSGKTTFIRAVGVNMILAQTINTCTAKQFSMPYSKIFSSITIADNLLEERSYYFEEMTIIKNFIDESSSANPCFFILDEIFKGTNTIERVSAGKAILSYLANSNNFVFVSTHDTELNELLKDQYDLYHFSETIDSEELIFDHLIKKGPLTTRNAIRILEINDYPPAIIVDANATVDLLAKANL